MAYNYYLLCARIRLAFVSWSQLVQYQGKMNILTHYIHWLTLRMYARMHALTHTCACTHTLITYY